MPTEPEKVTHTSHDLISAISNLNGLKLMPAVSLATVFSTIAPEVMGSDGCGGRSNQTQPFTMSGKLVGAIQVASDSVPTCSDSMVSALVSLTSQMATEDREEDFVDSEGSVTTNYDSECEGIHLPGPTIRELVGDLDKSWGNSKEWILQLRDGRQLVLPLSLYRSSDCMSISSSLEGECVPGNVSITDEGQQVSWANEGEGLTESLSVVPGSESEMWEFDERLRSCERGDEPLVVVPLATEGPLELVSSHVKEIGCKDSVDNCQLS